MSNESNLARKASILNDFFNEVKRGFITSRVENLYGFTFEFELGDEDAEVWTDNYIRPNTPFALISSRRAPRLATSIRAIGKDKSEPVKIAELFLYPDTMDADQRKELDSNPTQKKYWLWMQLLAFLLTLPSPVMERLYKEYDALAARQKQALEEAIVNPKS